MGTFSGGIFSPHAYEEILSYVLGGLGAIFPDKI